MGQPSPVSQAIETLQRQMELIQLLDQRVKLQATQLEVAKQMLEALDTSRSNAVAALRFLARVLETVLDVSEVPAAQRKIAEVCLLNLATLSLTPEELDKQNGNPDSP